ncbi:hypothetical protein Rsub_03454 [Raphidocelis subcapitata]|uniref:Fungal lipase-type domain-containing protein n=1 Tax=Raphidocelis subcapitata TaxID=307507 RepID=A0A2V0NS12_9CHLO|nr:hypothetical protein Rsub_03454 [Raphidocelis subcapitata]|eukprot:GBF90458.1 hypothetical protein Rsub_03454 [Raphidocelis subcapitata]
MAPAPRRAPSALLLVLALLAAAPPGGAAGAAARRRPPRRGGDAGDVMGTALLAVVNADTPEGRDFRRRHQQMESAAAGAAAAAAGGESVALGAAAGSARAAAAAGGTPVDITVDVNYICPLLGDLNAFSNLKSCLLVGGAESLLLQTYSNACPDPAAAGAGAQLQPPARAAGGGAAAPRPLPVRVPAPREFEGQARAEVLREEAATYTFLWAAVRNIYAWWTCSRDEGGSLDGYLLPAGFEGVGGDITSPGAYRLAGRPGMAILKRQSTGQLVVALRGSATKNDWATNFEYQRLLRPDFEPGFPGAYFPGEVHSGFVKVFRTVWPAVRAALDAEVLSGPPGLAHVVFTGHSQGAAVAELLAYAASKYLAHRGRPLVVDAVLFGSSAVGDSEFAEGVAALINIRNVLFLNDWIPRVPCTSSRLAGRRSMPACLPPIVPVPTRTGLRSYWADYQQSWGRVPFSPEDMPAQREAWAGTNLLRPGSIQSINRPGHVCSYWCFLSTFVSDLPVNGCVLQGPREGPFTRCDSPALP